MPGHRSKRAGAADMVNDMFSSAQPPGETFDDLLARLEAESGITPEPAAAASNNSKHSDPLPLGSSESARASSTGSPS
jgi:hypothetical protein